MEPPRHIPWRIDAGQIEVMDEAVVAILRKMTSAERIALTSQAHRTAREMTAARVRALHPDWTDEQVRAEVARRLTRGSS